MSFLMSQAQLILAAIVGAPLLIGGAVFYWKVAVPPRGQAEPDDNWPFLEQPWKWELMAFLVFVWGAYELVHGRLRGLGLVAASAALAYIAAVQSRRYRAGWFSTAAISALVTVWSAWSMQWTVAAIFAAHTAFLFFLAHRENP